MIYSRLTARFKKKEAVSVQVLAAAACISIGLFLFTYMRNAVKTQGWLTQNTLGEIHVVNMSPTGFEVAWTDTSSEVEHWLEWGTEKNIYTHKEVPQRNGEVYVAAISNLEPDHSYVFRIRAGAYTLVRGKESFFTVHTPKKGKLRPVSPAYGKVVVASGAPLTGGILIYSIDGMKPLMAVLKPSGEWLVPLSGTISKTTHAYESVRDDLPVQIHLVGKEGFIAKGRVADTRPTSHILQANLFTRLDKGGVAGGVLGASTVSDRKLAIQPQIIYPKERALIPGNKPLIRGIGVPGKAVNITIQGPKLQYGYRAESNEKGEWLVQYPLSLEPGAYTISASTVDLSGFPFTVRRSFSIIKSGEQVLGDATGSPTLAPTSALPSPTRTAVPTSIPTYSPISTAPTYTMPTLIPTRPGAVVPTAIPTLGGGTQFFGVAAVFFIVVGGLFILVF